jgi:hypothetical protein
MYPDDSENHLPICERPSLITREATFVTIHERDRYQLHQALDTHLGPDNAATLMAYLPPVGWADVATKHDLHALEERLELRIRNEIADVRTDMADLRAEVRTEIAGVRTEIAGVRTEISGVRGELRAELQHGLRTTTIVTVAANTAVVGAIATIANLF